MKLVICSDSYVYILCIIKKKHDSLVGEVHRGTVWDPAGICYPKIAAQDMSGPPVSDQTSVTPPANTQHRPRQVKP